MVGKVTLTEDGEALAFTMNDAGAWEGSDPKLKPLVDTLNSMFNIRNSSPADGEPGYREVNQATEWLAEFKAFTNVKAVFPERKPAPPGTIY